jgi:hypothetical protein
MKQSEATALVLTDLVAWARRNMTPLTVDLVEERVSELQGPVYAGTDRGVAAHRCAGTGNLHRRANALLRANV